MNKCPKCQGENIIMMEYGWPSKEMYDGISEYDCQDCGYRQGRWSGKELKKGYIEKRYGGKPVKE